MSRRKRGNGEGTVYERKDGRWEAAVRVGAPNGQRSRVRAYGATSAEARAALKAAVKRAEQGRPVNDSSVTVKAWLTTWQKPALAASARRESTQYTYTRVAEGHLVPTLGDVRLRDLRAHHVEGLMVRMEKAGLSGSTRRLALQVLRVALDTAVRDGLLASNPTEAVQRPRQTPQKDAVWYSPEETLALLDAAKGERWSPLLVTVAYLGLRIGEALALRWVDLDLDAGTLTVSGTLTRHGHATLTRTEPKSVKSRRTLPLPQAVRAVLAEQRRAQAVERLRAGESWRDSGAVFATEDGGWVEPRTVSRWYTRMATQAGVGGSWHSLRHSTATLLLTSGVPMSTVSAVLGHADVRTTVGVYGHVGAKHLSTAMAHMTEELG